jgi:hypothetical protein
MGKALARFSFVRKRCGRRETKSPGAEGSRPTDQKEMKLYMIKYNKRQVSHKEHG